MSSQVHSSVTVDTVIAQPLLLEDVPSTSIMLECMDAWVNIYVDEWSQWLAK